MFIWIYLLLISVMNLMKLLTVLVKYWVWWDFRIHFEFDM